MQKSDYKEINIEQFNGLYKRGMSDQTPADHAICCDNMTFRAKGETSSRSGSKLSVNTDHKVKTISAAAFSGDLTLLTLDFDGNLYKSNDPTPIFSSALMNDVAILNLFNKCFILPINNHGATPPPLQIWTELAATVRPAAGLRPAGYTMLAADGAPGDIDPGTHKIAVAFETDSGFITRPGDDVVEYAAPGGLAVDISAIPVGPTGTVARHILITRGNEKEYFRVDGGRIDDNTTTTLTLDFFDSDLVISADYLFDLLEEIPGAARGGSLYTYHGRLLSTAEGDLVRTSRSGDPESISDVDGFIQIPNNNDGNPARGMCTFLDTLYIMKGVGTYSVEDNSDVPSSWRIVLIAGSLGGYQPSISTILGSQHAVPDRGFTIGNRAGLFLFTGTYSERPLTWKIDNVWQRLSHFYEAKIQVVIDPFKQLMFVLLPVDGNPEPTVMLMGDFTEGLAWDTIKWSQWFFPFTVSCMSLLPISDDDGIGGFDYYLRLGSRDINGVVKHHEGLPHDLEDDPIVAYYQPGPVTFKFGWMNLFRAVQLRGRQSGTVHLDFWAEDLVRKSSALEFNFTDRPGQDYFRQINRTEEKLIMKFGVTQLDHAFTLDRITVFGKGQFSTRPA